ncbi:SDR family NAD(P)-dependent oxidoreductase, partial [Saccharibacillus sacchari]
MSHTLDIQAITSMLRNQEINPEQALKVFQSLPTQKPDPQMYESDYSVFRLKQEWMECPVEAAGYSSSVLFFSSAFGKTSFEQEIVGILDKKFKPSGYLRLGKDYKQKDESWTIDPDQAEHYELLLKDVAKKTEQPVLNLVFFAEQETMEFEKETSIFWSNVFFPLAKLIKGILGQTSGLQKELRVLFLSKEKETATSAFYRGIIGFIKSLQLEHPLFQGKTVRLPLDLDASSFKVLLESELSNWDRKQNEIKHQDGKRFVRCLNECSEKELDDTYSILRWNGVYVITGGIKGVGYLTAKYLAEKCQAKLILVGRSILSEEMQNRLEALKSFGAEVEYIQADVSKRENVVRIIETSKARFGLLHGIIHAAGLNKDSLFINK